MIPDFSLGLLAALCVTQSIVLVTVGAAVVWLWSKLRRFRKLWAEQDKGVRFGGELR